MEQIQKIMKNTSKIRRKKKKISVVVIIAMMIEGLCSVFRVYFQIWKSA